MKGAHLKKVFGIAAAALALTLGLSTPASAADHTHHMHTGDVWGNISGWSGEGVFTEEGDRVHICDVDADGYAVIMFVYKGAPATGYILYSFHVGGEGTCATKSAADGGIHNLPEGRIGFKFCRYKDSHDSECKDYDFLNDNS